MTFSFGKVADYFRAVAELGAADDREKQQAIAEVLGLSEERVVGKAVEGSAANEVMPVSATVRADVSPVTSSSSVPSARREDAPPLRYTLTKLPSIRRRPEWLEHVRPLPPPPKTSGSAPPAPPLFAPRWSRAILSTAMSRDTSSTTIDIEAIVAWRSRGLPIRRLPHRILPTLTHGVQLLVDRGPAAAPFLADQELLIQQIGLVAGNDRVQVLRFDPSRGFVAGSGSRLRWKDYFTLPSPPPGMTIVIISDLGIATVPHEGNATPAEWLHFINRLRARGNRVLAFVPYAPARWPAVLRRRAGMVPWDRRTNVQLVRRLLGRRVKRPETS
jgi:hypothetical protein